MTFEQWVSAVVGISGLVSSAVYAVRKMSRIEFKVELLWDFIFRRGIAESISNGWATMNSPLVVRSDVLVWFEPLKADLQALYKKNPKLSDKQLFMLIEKKFGEQLLKEVCIPHNMHAGACLILASQIAKGT